jgi:ATP-binding cassette subfamily B protein
MSKFPIFIQHDTMDCGVACIKMITDYYGQSFSFEDIKQKSTPTREGVSLSNIAQVFDEVGYKTIGGRLTIERLQDKAPMPCLIHWDQEHFVILYKVKKKKNNTIFYIADPGIGLVTYSKDEFVKHWCSTSSHSEDKGIVLVIEKKVEFEIDQPQHKSILKFNMILPYLYRYKKYFAFLILGLFLSSVIQLAFPFLTKSIVDVGIRNRNITFINTILIAQLVLLISKMCSEFVQNWMLLHISTRINISMVSDFLMKLMKLPMSFFDSKLTGDIIQRFEDHKRLESFITVQSLKVIYAVINFVVFGSVLWYFHTSIFGVFLIGSLLYVFWLVLFMKKRKVLDYKFFEQRALNDSKTYHLIQGMQEIKLQGCTDRMRWEWEDIQANLFDANVELLKLEQGQRSGSVFINETKNILIVFLAAYAVITGNLSIGVLIAIQFIIGQLSLPVEQIAQFIYNIQDTKISMQRISDIKNKDIENINRSVRSINQNTNNDISINNLSFAYEGTKKEVLKNININIPQGKTIAIVGASGSGKTTLIKLLLQYYNIRKGSISIGDKNLNNIDTDYWRSQCGVVMQDGYIFTDTIAKNIAISEDTIDLEKLAYASKMANLDEFVNQFPLKFNTIIGQEGRGLSQGQKQRILIARAIYKMPDFIFLDEATNALDANNERKITEKLNDFMKERTVFVVAHRLSTVRDADHIIVLHNGEIIEQGAHDELVINEGYYYNLIKNQLELAA